MKQIQFRDFTSDNYHSNVAQFLKALVIFDGAQIHTDAKGILIRKKHPEIEYWSITYGINSDGNLAHTEYDEYGRARNRKVY